MRHAALSLLVASTAAAQPCTPEWSDRFDSADFSDYASTLCFHNDGSGPSLFVACSQRNIAGQVVRGLVRFDGRQWHAVGGGLSHSFGNPSVGVLQPFPDARGTSLLVSGSFDTAGTVPVSNIAKWTGSAWTPMDAGLFTGGVQCAAVMDRGAGPILYAAGPSSSNNNNHAIARWTGSSWVTIANVNPSTTFPGTARVYGLAVFDSGSGPQLYAGGNIGFVNGQLVNGIARYNGTSWSSVGAVGGSAVYSLLVHDDGSGPHLYAGGLLGTVAGVVTPAVARYNGSAWSRVGVELQNTSLVERMRAFDPDGPGPEPAALYAAGRFVSTGPINNHVLARWDGTAWTQLGAGLYGTQSTSASVYDIEAGTLEGRRLLFTTGFFYRAGALPVSHFSAWSGSDWTPVAQGISAITSSGAQAVVRAAAEFEGQPYVCGNFTGAGQRTATGLARWSGGAWDPSGLLLAAPSSFPLQVNDLQVYDDGAGLALYVAGNFGSAGGVTARGVARLSAGQWSDPAPGGPAFSTVADLAVLPDSGTPRLFALGRFTTTSSGNTDFAKLVGGQWVRVGPQVPFFNGACAAWFDSPAGPTYYLGGATVTPTAAVRYLSAGTWTSIAAAGTAINRLLVHDDGSGASLIAAGRFTSITGVPVTNTARLRQGTWSSMGALADTTVSALTVFDEGQGPALYAGGAHTPSLSARLSRWDGQAWSTRAEFFQATPGTTIAALAPVRLESRPALFVSGQFARVGLLGSSNVAALLACDPPCYANCDASINPPILNINDFICFTNKYAAQDPYANCDNSTIPPVLNVNDFICFSNKYAAGCP